MEREQRCRVCTARAGNSGTPKYFGPRVAAAGSASQSAGRNLLYGLGSDRAGWSLARAYYSHRIGSDIELCEVVAVVDQNAPVTVLRKLPLKKTDVDVPGVTEWTPLDLADTRGTGQLDVISGRRCLREPLARSHQRATNGFCQDNFFWPWLLPVGFRHSPSTCASSHAQVSFPERLLCKVRPLRAM